jgi:hypothetical protein
MKRPDVPTLPARSERGRGAVGDNDGASYGPQPETARTARWRAEIGAKPGLWSAFDAGARHIEPSRQGKSGKFCPVANARYRESSPHIVRDGRGGIE